MINQYTIDEIMTIAEVAEKYEINLERVKNKLKPSIVGQVKLDEWTTAGIIRKSAGVWLLTDNFVQKIIFKN